MTPAGTRGMVRCPVHGRLVGVDDADRLLGCCPGCMTEAAQAQRMIERGELATQLVLTRERV